MQVELVPTALLIAVAREPKPSEFRPFAHPDLKLKPLVKSKLKQPEEQFAKPNFCNKAPGMELRLQKSSSIFGSANHPNSTGGPQFRSSTTESKSAQRTWGEIYLPT